MATSQRLTFVLAVVCLIVCCCGFRYIPVKSSSDSSKYPLRSEYDHPRNSTEKFDNPRLHEHRRRPGNIENFDFLDLEHGTEDRHLRRLGEHFPGNYEEGYDEYRFEGPYGDSPESPYDRDREYGRDHHRSRHGGRSHRGDRRHEREYHGVEHHGNDHYEDGHRGGNHHGRHPHGGHRRRDPHSRDHHRRGHHQRGPKQYNYPDEGGNCHRRSNQQNRYPSYQHDHVNGWRGYDPHCGVKGMQLGHHCSQNYKWSVIPPPPYDREASRFYDENEYPTRFRRSLRGFRVTFGNGRRSWWKGPNVCKNKTTEVSNITDTNLQVHQGSYTKSCDQSFVSVRCKTTIIEDAEKMEELEIMECCPGYTRKIGDYGCPKAVKLVDTFTFLKEHNLTNFLHALQAMGLDEEFQNENVTMFAPVNSGFDIHGKSLPAPKVRIDNEMLLKNVIIFSKSHADKNMEDITDTLLNHIVPALVKTNTMSNEDIITTASPLKSTIRLNTYYNPSKVLTANCVKVKSSDHQTKHGVVHIIEKVLEPVTDTLLEYIKTNPDLSVFSKVIEKLGFSNMLEGDEHLTVFAPTDSAFRKLEKRLYKKLLQGGDECSNIIIRNHILPNVICTAPIEGNVRTPNILKEVLQMSRDEAGKLFVNNAQMVVRDVLTTNGVIHIIDEVLVPESAKNFLDIAKSKNADIFASLFRTKEIKKYFTQLKNITVYLPNNEAMKAVNIEETVRDNVLMEILKYHFAKGTHSWAKMYNNMELDSLSEGKKLRINEYVRFFFNNKWTHTVQCVRTLTGPIRTCNGIVYLIDKMLTPPRSDVMTILRNDPRLTTFVNALNKNGLIQKIQNKTEPFTIFAPTNDAFNRLNAREREKAESDPSILGAYIYDTSVCCSSMEGTGFRIHGVHIISCDNMATDGVVHIVDRFTVSKGQSWWHSFLTFDNIF